MDIANENKTNNSDKPNKISIFKTKNEMKIGDYIRNYTLELMAVFFWVYIIIKIFVIDIDIWVLNHFLPDYTWILNFKLIYVLGLISLVWLWIGLRDFIVWFLYIIFYPLIILVIKMPFFIFKQKSWLFAFAVINSLVAFFKNLKYGLIFCTFFLASLFLVFFSSRDYILYIAIFIFIVLVLITYIKSFINALKPTVVFQIYTKFLKGLRKIGNSTFALDKDIKDLPLDRLDQKQLEKWNTNLQTSVLFNRVCLFTATKLRDYQRSEWRLVPYIFGLFWIIIFTVVTFTVIYACIFKLDPSSFAYIETPSLFTFLYFSFNNIVFNSIQEIIPAVVISKSVYMFQTSLSFILGLILVTLMISNKTQKSSLELDEVIIGVETEAKSMESFINEEYNIPNINDAMEHLKDAKSGLVQFIYWFSSRLK